MHIFGINICWIRWNLDQPQCLNRSITWLPTDNPKQTVNPFTSHQLPNANRLCHWACIVAPRLLARKHQASLVGLNSNISWWLLHQVRQYQGPNPPFLTLTVHRRGKASLFRCLCHCSRRCSVATEPAHLQGASRTVAPERILCLCIGKWLG